MWSYSHWGDLSVLPDTESGIAAIEREQMTKPRPIDVEGPRLYQPSSRHYPPSAEPSPSDQFDIDPITKHTILLHQYAKKIRQFISIVQQQYESVKNGEGAEMLSFPAPPAIPEYQGPEIKKCNIRRPFPFVPRDPDCDFVRGIGAQPPPLDDYLCRKLLRRSVAAIFAHIGYDTCAESILEAMTDVCTTYLHQMTTALRHARDREAMTGHTGFQDILDHVFHEMGLGDVSNLHDFYQTRVIQYHEHMISTCQRLVDEYERVKHPEYRNSGDFKHLRVKEEPLSDIQFPALTDEDETAQSGQIVLPALGGLDIQVEQDNSANNFQNEDSAKWMQNIKAEPLDAKTAILESYDDISEDEPTSPSADAEHDETPKGGAAAAGPAGAVTGAPNAAASVLNAAGTIAVTEIMSPPPYTKIKRKRIK